VYLSQKEAALLNGKVQRAPFTHNHIDCPYQIIRDQADLTIGNIKVKGILTPGHTVGSISYLIDNRYLFVGDAMSLKNGHAEVFNEFFNMDSKTLLKSFDKLRNLSGVEYIFTAHYGKERYTKVFAK
jgi:glyoxylase-like metal-dependent hydrolase (beta-lactamase superfamily II)